MSNASNPVPRTRYVPLVLFLAVSAVGDFITPAILNEAVPRGPLVPALLAGLIAGQFGLLAIWAVVGAEPWVARLPLVLLIAVGLHGLFVLGMAAADVPAMAVAAYAKAMLLLPLVLAAGQVPLWIARMALGCRVVFRADAAMVDPSRLSQFGVQHLLGATTVAALTLALAQVGISLFASPYGFHSTEIWTGLLITCAAAAGIGALAALPCVWAVLLARRTGLAMVIVVMYTVAAAVLVPIVIGAIAGNAPDSEEFQVFFWLHVGGMGMMLVGLHVVRACGYTMLRRGRPVPGDGSPPVDGPLVVMPEDPAADQ